MLLNGTSYEPGVWVFDPHDSTNGVENTYLSEPGQVADLIEGIQRRLKHGNRKNPTPQVDSAPPPAPPTASDT